MTEDAATPKVSEEQVLYAKVLEIGMSLGLGLLLVTFSLYIFGIVAPCVPVEELPNYWVMNVDDYVEATNSDHLHHEHPITGWSWLSVLGKGDYLNFLGIAVLSTVSIICFLWITPTLLRKKDWIYAAMALLEVAILTFAASGILAVGH
jgi:hypothetical protein